MRDPKETLPKNEQAHLLSFTPPSFESLEIPKPSGPFTDAHKRRLDVFHRQKAVYEQFTPEMHCLFLANSPALGFMRHELFSPIRVAYFAEKARKLIERKFKSIKLTDSEDGTIHLLKNMLECLSTDYMELQMQTHYAPEDYTHAMFRDMKDMYNKILNAGIEPHTGVPTSYPIPDK